MPHDDVPLTDWPAELDPDHIAYLTARAVTPAVARARGYASLKAGRRSASLDGSYSTMLGLGPHGGLLIPLRGILAPDGEDRQIRLPDGAGDKKFLTPAGQSPVLVTHPATVAAVTEDADSPLIVAEGVTRVDALAAYGIPAVGILGCYGWRGGTPTKALADWEPIPLQGRRVIIALDGDVTTNQHVAGAGQRLARMLAGRGATAVGSLALPDGLGLDDWIARERPADDRALMDGLRPYLRPYAEVVAAATPTTAATVADGTAPPDWFDLGVLIAEGGWLDGLEWDPALESWWTRDEAGRWSLVKLGSRRVADALMRRRREIAKCLADRGHGGLADRWARTSASAGGVYRTMAVDGGLRDAMSRVRAPVPWHCLPLPEGVMDLTTGVLTPHGETPYRVTAVAGAGWDRSLDRDAAQTIVDARLEPAIPDPGRRDALLWAAAAALGGLAGGRLRGSLLFLTGDSGGGKGNTIRYLADVFGDLAVPGWQALTSKGEINEALARVLVARARLLTLSEQSWLPMGRILEVTGRDALGARAPHEAGVKATLHTAVAVTAADVPRGAMHSGGRRRLLAIPFDGRAADRASSLGRRPTDDVTDDERAALLTILIDRAMKLQAGRIPDVLLTESDDIRAAVAEADPVADWVAALRMSDHGQPVAALLERMHAERPEARTMVTSSLTMGKRIRAHGAGRLETRQMTWQGGPKISRLVVHSEPKTFSEDDEPSETNPQDRIFSYPSYPAGDGEKGLTGLPCGDPSCRRADGQCARTGGCPDARG